MGFIIAFVKKITAAVFSILCFSFLIFAQPGGASGGHGGPGGGPGGGPSGPGGPANPGGKAPAPGSHPAPHPFVEPGSSGSTASSGSGSSSSPAIINYRGERKVASDFPLEVLCTSLTKNNNNYNLAVHFNQSIASEKITSESVFFNGKNIGSSVIIKFNRKSDSVTIIWSQSLYSQEEIDELSIQLKNVQTFDGKFIEELKVK